MFADTPWGKMHCVGDVCRYLGSRAAGEYGIGRRRIPGIVAPREKFVGPGNPATASFADLASEAGSVGPVASTMSSGERSSMFSAPSGKVIGTAAALGVGGVAAGGLLAGLLTDGGAGDVTIKFTPDIKIGASAYAMHPYYPPTPTPQPIPWHPGYVTPRMTPQSLPWKVMPVFASPPTSASSGLRRPFTGMIDHSTPQLETPQLLPWKAVPMQPYYYGQPAPMHMIVPAIGQGG